MEMSKLISTNKILKEIFEKNFRKKI